MPSLREERLAGIWRRWRLLSGTRALAQSWDWTLSFLVGILSLLASFHLEWRLWKFIPEPWWASAPIIGHPVGWGAVVLLAAWNGWIMARFLESPLASRLPLWLRGLWAVIASLPLIGMYAVPSWRWLLSHQPPWLRRRLRPEPELDLSRAERTAGSRWLLRRFRQRIVGSQTGIVLWFLMGQVMPVGIALTWLADADLVAGPRRWVVLASCIAFRSVAVVSFLIYGHAGLKLSNSRLRLARVLCLGLLLPLPLAMLAFCGFLLLAMEPDARAVVWSFYRQQKGRDTRLRALSLWTLQDRLPTRWRSQSAQRTERELRESLPERYRRSFYRLKILLLFLDGGALGWWLVHFRQPVFAGWGSTALLACLALAGLGLILSIVGLVARALGFRKLDHLSHLYLTSTQVALMYGLLVGSALATGQLEQTGQLGVSLFALGAVLFGMRIMVAGGDGMRLRDAVARFSLWAAVSLGFSLLAIESGIGGEPFLGFQTVLRWAFWLSPVWNLALGLGLGGWLVQPFPLRLFIRGLPWRRQALLAFLSLTALLPLGGLAVPFWVLVRHRGWPEGGVGSRSSPS